MGISPDDAKSHQKFRTKYNLPFILLCDTNNTVAEKYGVWGEKSIFGVKTIGVIRSHFVIDEQGKIIDAQIKVNAKASPMLVIQSIKEE